MTDAEVNTEQETVRRELLTQRLAAVGTLAEGLAHEVYNPLNCALLQLAVLQRRLEQPECETAALQPVADLVEHALRRLELLFNDFVWFLQPRPGDRRLLAAGDRCPAVVTLARADSDGGGMRVAFDIILELPPVDDRLRLVLAHLWPGPREVNSDGPMVLRAREPDGRP